MVICPGTSAADAVQFVSVADPTVAVSAAVNASIVSFGNALASELAARGG